MIFFMTWWHDACASANPTILFNWWSNYVFIGFFVPLPGVIIALTFKKHQYRIIRFPPDVCTTDNELWFFTTTLIFTVVIGIGICLLIIIFWTVNKVSWCYCHFKHLGYMFAHSCLYSINLQMLEEMGRKRH